jgi:DNA-binding GntR family transcriptional regulator
MKRTLERPIGGISIKPVSVASQVASALREKILAGDLRPGMPLHEISLAESASVSRNTIREAVQILVREGLVRHNVHRGAAVTELANHDVDDIYRVRRTLEVAGVYASVNVEPAEIVALEESIESMGRAVDAKDWLQSVASDILFHRQLVGFLGSDRLNGFFGALLSELRLVLVYADSTGFSGEHLVPQHSELVQLLKAGRVADCAAALIRHLEESEQNIRRVLGAQSNKQSSEVLASFSV